MYQYNWDNETGGILLTTEQSKFSKEPRPVYFQELDILGFDKHWNYPKNDSAPLLWAEANNYIYKGKLVAKTKGGSLYSKPELILLEDPEPNNAPLQFVDIEKMCQKNKELMETLEQDTIKKIYNTYREYKNKIDIFYVAFSGGKDSIVALDLVQRALPHTDFKVVFGDTGMEFPDTYETCNHYQALCNTLGIDFYIAKSELSPFNTWEQFGPPSQTIRWCCSVHKTTPQILLLRKLTSNTKFKGMAFTGIRADESLSRSQYNEISYGEKHKGQFSCHPILNWNSAEIFTYLFSHHLQLNDTYKKGNSRAGCLVCPMAAQKNIYFKQIAYSNHPIHNTTAYNKIITKTCSKTFSSQKEEDNFMDIGGWKARRSGRELNFAQNNCIEEQSNNILQITLLKEKTSWKEWIKTLGEIITLSDNLIEILHNKNKYSISYKKDNEHIIFTCKVNEISKKSINFFSALKIIFRKSAYCITCQVCEANCPFGYITMNNGQVHIDEKCCSCKSCHKIEHGCLVSNSLKLPKGEIKMGSIDRYGNIGIELDWIYDFYNKLDEFWNNNSLGTNKIKNMKVFLSDAQIILPKKYSLTYFGHKIKEIGIQSINAWALILVNLSYTSEFNWWIINTTPDKTYTSLELQELLKKDVNSNNSIQHIISAYKNIFYSNHYLGIELGLGNCNLKEGSNKRILIDIKRSSWASPIPEVILYSLYKFAEACDNYYQFSLETLLDDSIERTGVSPTRIFGLDRETMIKILNGLSISYPEFISASFTLDLDNITLRDDKSSEDVLSLF